jgi:cobyrinic acid a,c-diamide synthase
MAISSALPRVLIAGLAGSTGKTLVACGLTRALARRGLVVAPFKKGPDYIDPAWLGVAAGRPARTLDGFLMSADAILGSLAATEGADLALIEGNRGLFDGLDARGTFSTAELAKQVQAPVVLVVDVTKATRTVAALVLGCRLLDREVPLRGVVLNRVGSARQERLIRAAIASTSGVPVLGAIPRLSASFLPSRHLGLVTPGEHTERDGALQALADVIDCHLDVAGIAALAREAPDLTLPAPAPAGARRRPGRVPARIGILRDAAFSFYYPENLAALVAAGATLVPFSPLADAEVPDIDALYAGGGFPEAHAAALADNVRLRAALATRIAAGLPVWAECGGLMYLAAGLHVRGRRFPMVGALPVEIEQTARPQGHGYVEAEVVGPNPFLAPGTRLRGHEFHYSRLRDALPAGTVLALRRGVGLGQRRDGLVVGRIFASYLHVFAPGAPAWAPAFVAAAREARVGRPANPCHQGEPRGTHDGREHFHRDRRGRLHPGAWQVEQVGGRGARGHRGRERARRPALDADQLPARLLPEVRHRPDDPQDVQGGWHEARRGLRAVSDRPRQGRLQSRRPAQADRLRVRQP